MKTSGFGFWAMLAFWVSAIGGIVVGVVWARRRNRNPVDPERLKKSLRSRLDSGELSHAEYEKRLEAIQGTKDGRD